MTLNPYMSQKLEGLDAEDKCEDVLTYAQNASDFGVSSDREHALYFFVRHNLDELVDDTFGQKLDPEDLEALKKYVFSFKSSKEYDVGSLVDLRILVYKWLSDRALSKQAHPNIGGIYVRPSDIDVGKWTQVAQSIYSQINDGQSRTAAFKAHTQGWDRDEVTKFENWLKYYEEHTPEKYNVKTANIIKTAFGEGVTIPAEWENPAYRAQQPQVETKTKKELEMERATRFKSQMKSRMRALRALMDKYNDLLPHQNLDGIYEEMLALEKSVGRLNAYAALEDRVICSATKLEKLGFAAGSMMLKEAVGADETILPPGALKGNIGGVLTKLEGISKELKMRNLIREMSRADIMLAELGIASYFPEIAESIARMIEGFGYASNRIEETLSKLRGTNKTGPATPEPKLPEPKLPGQPSAPATPEPIPTPLSTPTPAPTEKLEPSALHDRPISKVRTQLPAAPTPPVKPGV